MSAHAIRNREDFSTYMRTASGFNCRSNSKLYIVRTKSMIVAIYDREADVWCVWDEPSDGDCHWVKNMVADAIGEYVSVNRHTMLRIFDLGYVGVVRGILNTKEK